MLILVAGAFLIFKVLIPEKTKSIQEEMAPAAEHESELTTETKESLRHAIGKFVILNWKGDDISQIDTAVVNGRWIAVPVCVCLGGNNWVFRSVEMGERDLSGGIWSSKNPVGLWQLKKGEEYESLKLAPLNRGAPLEWHSLDMARSVRQVVLNSPKKEGHFTSISLPDNISEPGVFIQENQIVGWTFGEWMGRGFLWDEPKGFDLATTVGIDEFINEISVNWQETQFSKGLALGETSSSEERLEVLSEGFMLNPQYSIESKPSTLFPESIISQIHSLSSELIQTGSAIKVADILNEQIVLDSANPDLLKEATLARVKAHDHWKAIRFFESIKKHFVREDEQIKSDLDMFHSQLYREWVKHAIAEKNFHSGQIGFDMGKSLFPDDVELHILGIDLAVAEKDWERAEEIIEMREYPKNYDDRINSLESLIEKRLDEEKNVIIRFKPGADQIPVRAYLNRNLWQDFIVDTGANITSIPSSTVEALRLKITNRTKTKYVTTASGWGYTFEVMLDSIEIEGFRVRNLPVLIIDLPGDPDVGLLGTNFLNKFNVEIDNEKGTLKLSPR